MREGMEGILSAVGTVGGLGGDDGGRSRRVLPDVGGGEGSGCVAGEVDDGEGPHVEAQENLAGGLAGATTGGAPGKGADGGRHFGRRKRREVEGLEGVRWNGSRVGLGGWALRRAGRMVFAAFENEKSELCK